MDDKTYSGDGWSLIWIDAILLIPAIFGIMFLGLVSFIVVAVTTAVVIGWMLLAQKRTP
jgi:hypothetical protein